MVIIKNNPLVEFVSKSIEMGAYEIEIEYKDGFEMSEDSIMHAKRNLYSRS